MTIATGLDEFVADLSFWKSGAPPDFADAWGRDEIGAWFEFSAESADGKRVTQRLRWVAPGRFFMGSPETEPGRWPNEGPRHEVVVGQGFWMFDTTCTQALWQAVMAENPSRFKAPDRPVERVSWHDCLRFVERLPHLGLTLPSEAQWEYACRAGTTTPFSFGSMVTTDQINYDGNYPYPGCPVGPNRRRTVPVASLPANPWGLYEMHGNVWEWCADEWHATYDGAPTDGRAWVDGAANRGAGRVLRGGSWSLSARNARSAYRFAFDANFCDVFLGFRCALMQEGVEPAPGRRGLETQRRDGPPRRTQPTASAMVQPVPEAAELPAPAPPKAPPPALPAAPAPTPLPPNVAQLRPRPSAAEPQPLPKIAEALPLPAAAQPQPVPRAMAPLPAAAPPPGPPEPASKPAEAKTPTPPSAPVQEAKRPVAPPPVAPAAGARPTGTPPIATPVARIAPAPITPGTAAQAIIAPSPTAQAAPHAAPPVARPRMAPATGFPSPAPIASAAPPRPVETRPRPGGAGLHAPGDAAPPQMLPSVARLLVTPSAAPPSALARTGEGQAQPSAIEQHARIDAAPSQPMPTATRGPTLAGATGAPSTVEPAAPAGSTAAMLRRDATGRDDSGREDRERMPGQPSVHHAAAPAIVPKPTVQPLAGPAWLPPVANATPPSARPSAGAPTLLGEMVPGRALSRAALPPALADQPQVGSLSSAVAPAPRPGSAGSQAPGTQAAAPGPIAAMPVPSALTGPAEGEARAEALPPLGAPTRPARPQPTAVPPPRERLAAAPPADAAAKRPAMPVGEPPILTPPPVFPLPIFLQPTPPNVVPPAVAQPYAAAEAQPTTPEPAPTIIAAPSTEPQPPLVEVVPVEPVSVPVAPVQVEPMPAAAEAPAPVGPQELVPEAAALTSPPAPEPASAAPEPVSEPPLPEPPLRRAPEPAPESVRPRPPVAQPMAATPPSRPIPPRATPPAPSAPLQRPAASAQRGAAGTVAAPSVAKPAAAPFNKPDWAAAVGRDKFGLWTVIQIDTGKAGPVSQRLRWLPYGKFQMGTPDEERERKPAEGPRHEVTMPRGFWMFETACPQALWEAIMEDNPSRFKGPDRPVENVGWADCQVFIERVNAALPGLALSLPSEAQWEYACRAGTTTPFSFGPTVTAAQVNYNGTNPYAGAPKGPNRAETVPVRALPANAWGLYQMHGNVWEWCEDHWHDSYQGAPANGAAWIDAGAPANARRVLRGGSWLGFARLTRAGFRFSGQTIDGSGIIGFRCARVQR
jgi:formylglycine-generating enzyme required for sulfatase activity